MGHTGLEWPHLPELLLGAGRWCTWDLVHAGHLVGNVTQRLDDMGAAAAGCGKVGQDAGLCLKRGQGHLGVPDLLFGPGHLCRGRQWSKAYIMALLMRGIAYMQPALYTYT